MSGFRQIVVILVLGLLFPLGLCAQSVSLSGTVTDKRTGEPVGFATVVVEASEQWAVADAQGRFVLKNISVAESVVKVDCLGYVTWSREMKLGKSVADLRVQLLADNLSLESAVVTAQENANSATTTRTIDKLALDHVQLMNVSDIAGLLPGGATAEPTLTGERQFTIRAGSSESGNASFGTAVEVDGVRLSNNASFGTSANSLKGVSTNNIASSNIESVEVITGVPSVEYGDMSSGVVKINTRRGKTRWGVTMSTGPRTKQFSVSKGFDLGATRKGRSRGVINASLERTRSISDPMSPYTAYDRNQLALTWSGQILGETPLRLSVGVTGNLGGLDDRADPDKRTDVWLTRRDDGVRANLTANWLLSKSWITNIELNASASYGDKRERQKSQYHSAVSATSLHALDVGYYMAADYVAGGENPAVRIAPGTWYHIMDVDDRPLSTKVTLKANWARNAGRINNKLKVGADWTTDRNFGTGVGTEDLALAPSFREWRYCDVPTMTNLAAYAEENLMLRTGDDARLNLIAGLRWDNTLIPASAYGTTSSLSPRFNAKYTFFTEKGRGDAAFLRELSLRASWGVAVKQPSFSVLYPTPSYLDINVFTSTADANNVVSRAYFVMPRSIAYNADLVWQRNHQSEVGLEANLGGAKVSLAFFYNQTFYAYNLQSDYERFEYTYTPVSAVQNLSIPAEDRVYALGADGTVTVSDRQGVLPDVQVAGSHRKQLISSYFEDNDDNPVRRYGLEWVIDFPRIRPLNTTIRVDGTYYAYRSLYTDLVAYSPTSQMSSDGTPYKYIGYYYGDDGISNGRQTRALRTNLTFTTNIPEVRMVFSMKVEASLLSYSRNLSERLDGSARSYVLSDRTDLLSMTDASVYDSESGCYTVSFPDTYCSFDDPTPRPFLEDFLRARSADPALYTDLTKLVVAGTTYSYTFLEDFISPYFSVNFSVTKEIGDLASISFYANNFFNNMGQVYSTRTGTWSSASSYIPRFHYGLTLRLNF